MIFVAKEVNRNPASTAVDTSFIGMEKPHDGARDSDGSVRQSGGSGSNPSGVLPYVDPAASSAERDADIEEEAARVSESEDTRNYSPSANAGIERPVPVQAENRVSNAGAATQEPVSLQLALAPQAAPPKFWMHGFQIGDMVWGKVKSHPWWPGYIYNVFFAPPNVRRTRKERYLLVAFFGDSSYGWFLPDEIIPFEPYYLEKSKQTTSKNFVLAMDEAVYEESRRAALGLTCRCRDATNLRYFGFPGYVCVDVPGYERGAEYSVKQIDGSRESFVPEELLSFLLQLALASQSEEPWCIDFIRRKARLLAYRKAVYEEYDETYPQAFGVEPVRPSPSDAQTSDQLVYFAPRAMLLHGQLTIAENLEDVRLFSSSSSRPATSAPKIPSSLKKTKYVLKKQREGPGLVKHARSSGGSSRPTPFVRSSPPRPYETTRVVHCHKSPQGQSTAASSSLVAGNYVLQRPPKLTSEGGKVATSSDLRASSEQKETKLAAGLSAVQQASAIGSNLKGEPLPTDTRSSNNLTQETKPAVDLPASDRGAREGSSLNGVVKKKKAPKRLRDDAGSVGLEDSGGIKKKKKKEVLGVEAGHSSDGREFYGKFDAGRSISTGLGDGQIGQTKSQRRDDLHSAAARQPIVDVSSLSLEFPQLLSDLKELAADPSYAIERNAPSVVLQVFSNKFRSQVYQKSLHPPESGHDMAKLQATRIAVARSLMERGAGNADMAFGKEAKDRREPSSAALKLLKPRLKPDGPTKVVRKRGPSDQQEKSNEKKPRKMNQLSALAMQKKAGIGLRKPEGQQRNQKESRPATVTASAKPNNKGAETVKKQEPPSPSDLPLSPTALVMKFLLETSLPSVAKLKARMAVFGPLVKDSTRVYWKSNSCRVVFKHKPHAEAALNYARKNDLLLGPLRCYIRELDPTTLKPLSFNPGNLPRPQSHPSHGPLLIRPGNGGQPRAIPYQQQQAPTVQLKSILKKRGDVGGGSVGNAAREAPQRVTFMLDGRDDSGREKEPPVVPAVSMGNIGGSYAAGSSSSLPLMDPMTNSKDPKSSGLLPTPPPPLQYSLLSNPPPLPPSISLPPPPRAAGGRFPSISLPLPPPPRVVGGPLPPPPPLPHTMGRFETGGSGAAQFHESRLQHSGQPAVVEGRNKPDISSQMLILLRRCSDIVDNIESSPGYIPYHPL